jgi:hypothetical protein
MTSNIEEFAAKACAELLRRKYTVERDSNVLNIGLGEFKNIMRAEVVQLDVDTPLQEFCDNVVKNFDAYLDRMHEDQVKIIDESAGHFDKEVRPITFPTFVRNAFVASRSERLSQANQGKS